MTVYSYFSTWSTNYTMSNFIGPGRLLGNLYSKAGASLEERLGKLADHTGTGGYAKSKAILGNDYMLFEMLESEDMAKTEKACRVLLRCARYLPAFPLVITRTIILTVCVKDQIASNSRSWPSGKLLSTPFVSR